MGCTGLRTADEHGNTGQGRRHLRMNGQSGAHLQQQGVKGQQLVIAHLGDGLLRVLALSHAKRHAAAGQDIPSRVHYSPREAGACRVCGSGRTRAAYHQQIQLQKSALLGAIQHHVHQLHAHRRPVLSATHTR